MKANHEVSLRKMFQCLSDEALAIQAKSCNIAEAMLAERINIRRMFQNLPQEVMEQWQATTGWIG